MLNEPIRFEEIVIFIVEPLICNRYLLQYRYLITACVSTHVSKQSSIFKNIHVNQLSKPKVNLQTAKHEASSKLL